MCYMKAQHYLEPNTGRLVTAFTKEVTFELSLKI